MIGIDARILIIDCIIEIRLTTVKRNGRFEYYLDIFNQNKRRRDPKLSGPDIKKFRKAFENLETGYTKNHNLLQKIRSKASKKEKPTLEEILKWTKEERNLTVRTFKRKEPNKVSWQILGKRFGVLIKNKKGRFIWHFHFPLIMSGERLKPTLYKIFGTKFSDLKALINLKGF